MWGGARDAFRPIRVFGFRGDRIARCPIASKSFGAVLTGSTAEQVAKFRPSPEAQKRVAELLEKQRESQLTAEENSELDGFVQINTFSVWREQKPN